MVSPVSYTHLDVYKRQLQGYGLTLPIPDALLGVNREKAQAITLAEYKLIESQFVTSYEYELSLIHS